MSIGLSFYNIMHLILIETWFSWLIFKIDLYFNVNISHTNVHLVWLTFLFGCVKRQNIYTKKLYDFPEIIIFLFFSFSEHLLFNSFLSVCQCQSIDFYFLFTLFHFLTFIIFQLDKIVLVEYSWKYLYYMLIFTILVNWYKIRMTTSVISEAALNFTKVKKKKEIILKR